MVDVAGRVNDHEWRDFLLSRSNATLYHTPEWKECLQRTFRYSSKYLFASDENGILTGILPLFLVNGRLFGRRLVTLPFSHVCGPVGDPESVNCLLEEAIALAEKMGDIPLILNSPVDSPRFGNSTNFSTYILDLNRDVNLISKKLGKGCRRAIIGAKKKGVTVRESREPFDLKEFHYLNSLNKKELGVPCHPLHFFENISIILSNMSRLYIAERDHEMIGGSLMLHYKDKVIYGYGAANPSALNYHPYHAVIWQSIQDACAEGYQSYDFGRCFHNDTGLMDFKRRWGTRELPLTYSNFPPKSRSGTNRSGAVVDIGGKILRHLPLGIYTALSERVFRELG